MAPASGLGLTGCLEGLARVGRSAFGGGGGWEGGGGSVIVYFFLLVFLLFVFLFLLFLLIIITIIIFIISTFVFPFLLTLLCLLFLLPSSLPLPPRPPNLRRRVFETGRAREALGQAGAARQKINGIMINQTKSKIVLDKCQSLACAVHGEGTTRGQRRGRKKLN